MSNTQKVTNRVQPSDQGMEIPSNQVSTEYSVSSTTRTGARAREGAIGPEALEGIRRAYEGVIGPLTEYTAREIEGALSAGMAPDVIEAAIRITAAAPRPSFAYLRAVLRRWARDGLWTMADVAADQERHQASQSSWWSARRNPALNYEQRTYTEAESREHFYFDVVSAYGGERK